MDKLSLEKRLAELEQHIQQQMGTLNMLIGGKEEIKHWLKKIEESENDQLTTENN